MKHPVDRIRPAGVRARRGVRPVVGAAAYHHHPSDQAAQATTADPAYDSFEGSRKGTREVTLNGGGASGSQPGRRRLRHWHRQPSSSRGGALLPSMRRSMHSLRRIGRVAPSSTNGSTRVAADYHFNADEQLHRSSSQRRLHLQQQHPEQLEISPEDGVKVYVSRTGYSSPNPVAQFHTRNDFEEGS